jgi:hypothetical protein
MQRTGISLLASLFLASPMAMGAVSDEDFAALRAELATLSDRLEALATENADLRQQHQDTAEVAEQARIQAAAATGTGGSTSWTDRMSLNGDFRYRYENIDIEGKDDQNRSRIQARANIIANLPQNVEVGFGLATGGEDPVSTNQTIGSGGSSKDIRLNLAYADWSPTEGLHLVAGKFKNRSLRVAKNGLMWDGDWTPEGLAITYERGWFFGNAMGSWLESDSKTGNSEFSWGGQVGVRFQPGGVKLQGGIGYYAFKTKGNSTFFGDPDDPANYFGNTAVGPNCGAADGTCIYAFDYLMTQVFGEAGFELVGLPTVLFVDFVNNSDPGQNDTAWSAGTRIGQTRKAGDWQFSYWYADKEADSVFGLLTDSDFGDGGTDSKGHFLKLAYGVNKFWALDMQYFINKIDVSTDEKDYNRLMLNTAWKYK